MLFKLLRGPTVEGRLYRRMAAFWSLAPPKNVEDDDEDENDWPAKN